MKLIIDIEKIPSGRLSSGMLIGAVFHDSGALLDETDACTDREIGAAIGKIIAVEVDRQRELAV